MTRKKINKLSRKVGSNPLLIQGAGGNISWKENNTIFVKGSGTWLSDAEIKNIFVSMDLIKVREQIIEGIEDYQNAIQDCDTKLRPSIETALHVLLPRKIVLHLHPVELIALTVMPDAISELKTRLVGIDWDWIEYIKPGKNLANAINNKIEKSGKNPSVWILLNHGLVISADSVKEIEIILDDLIQRFKLPIREPRLAKKTLISVNDDWAKIGYLYVANPLVQSLAFDKKARKLCQSAWVLYPDHAVFLGPQCWIGHFIKDFPNDKSFMVVLIPNVGVFLNKSAPLAAKCMLECYAQIIFRLPKVDPLALSSKAVAELVEWDAEKYRKTIQK